MVLAVHERAVFVLGLYIAVQVLQKQHLFQRNPGCKLLGSGFNSVSCHQLACFANASAGPQPGHFFIECRHCGEHLLLLESVDRAAHGRSHDVIHLVACLGHPVGNPELGGRGIVEHVAVAYAQALRDFPCRDINGCKIGCCSIVGAEPHQGSDLVGQPAAGLRHEPEAGLLGGDCTFVHVGLSIP